MAPFWRQGSDFLQRGPAEEQTLLPHLRESHGRLGLFALPLDVDDHALAPFGVTYVITHPQAEHLGAVLDRPLWPQGPLHDLVTVAVHRRGPAPRPERLALPGAGLSRSLGVLEERCGNLVEEPARR